MVDLLVITHNGKSPAEGGKRLGYLALGDFFIPAGETNFVSLCAQAQAQKKKEKKPIILDYWELGETTPSGKCPNCQNYCHSEKHETTTGKRTVWRCHQCKTLLRLW